jgi:hypothetical protein
MVKWSKLTDISTISTTKLSGIVVMVMVKWSMNRGHLTPSPPLVSTVDT